MTYDLIDPSGVIINVIEIADLSQYTPPAGYTIQPASGTFGLPPPPPPKVLTSIDATIERDRRLGLGFNYTFSDSRGTQRIGTTKKDLEGWDEVSKLASAFIAVGAPNSPIYIVTNTGAITVTAMEWQQVLLSAAQFRQPIWQSYFTLVAASPIPADYTADYHWPPLT